MNSKDKAAKLKALRQIMRKLRDTKRRGGNYRRLEEHARTLRRNIHRQTTS